MFSIIAPMDTNRLDQFKQTKLAYDDMPEVKEIIIPTRSYHAVTAFLDVHKLKKDVRVIPYKHSTGFNPSKALNIGVREARYDNIIITSPEVKPSSGLLGKLAECLDKNIICQVFDQSEDGNLISLVHSSYRSESPAMYFLAMFRRQDIEKINGWDEEFMKGYAYEDNDFGARWVRAGLPFEVRDDLQATHQYHHRSETIPGGLTINQQHYYDNTDNGVTYCEKGLKNDKISLNGQAE